MFRIVKYGLLATLFAGFAICQEIDDATTTTSKIIELTNDNFETAINSNNHFVMFFAPWCGHSKKLIPTWELLADLLNVEDNQQVVIAKVDCSNEKELCSSNQVTGYPTLRFFKLNTIESVKFKGPRDLPTLTSFINEQMGDKHEDDTDDSDENVVTPPEPISRLVELTEDTFAKHISNGKHFVKFYAPWCSHCQRLAPTWDELAQSLEHTKSVSIAKIDCTLHRPICQDFDVKGYPTLLWIEDGKKIEKYSGSRTIDELKSYVAKHAGTTIIHGGEDNTIEGETIAPVAIITGGNFEHIIDDGVTFVKFYAPWCGHCQKLSPVWDELGTKLLNQAGVKIGKVDCTLADNKDLCVEQQVEGYPTLYIYKNGEKIKEYNGPRQLSDLYDFVITHTSSASRDEL